MTSDIHDDLEARVRRALTDVADLYRPAREPAAITRYTRSRVLVGAAAAVLVVAGVAGLATTRTADRAGPTAAGSAPPGLNGTGPVDTSAGVDDTTPTLPPTGASSPEISLPAAVALPELAEILPRMKPLDGDGPVVVVGEYRLAVVPGSEPSQICVSVGTEDQEMSPRGCGGIDGNFFVQGSASPDEGYLRSVVVDSSVNVEFAPGICTDSATSSRFGISLYTCMSDSVDMLATVTLEDGRSFQVDQLARNEPTLDEVQGLQQPMPAEAGRQISTQAAPADTVDRE